MSQRKSIQFALLLGALIVVCALGVSYYLRRDTERREALRQAVERVEADANVGRLLGAPITIAGEIKGGVKVDETGWQEVSLVTRVRGPRAEGVLKVAGGRQTGPWRFTTLEVVLPGSRQRIDALTHRVVQQDPEAFVESHTEAAVGTEFIDIDLPPARWDGNFPCVQAPAGGGPVRVDRCPMLMPGADRASGWIDRFEVDLRYGKFILRQTDLMLEMGEGRVPLTRTYTSQFWIHRSRANAFGVNSTHNFDVAPVGSRNPYLDQFLVLPDGDFLYFSRISKGSGYADAVYRHDETSSRFYNAITRWDGHGWDTRLADGSVIHFPESYEARNMAQGAATEITDPRGQTLQLIRDPRRNLVEVQAPGNRRMRLSHDSEGRVVRAEDDRGQSVEYIYAANGLLTDVRRSDGSARHYTYQGNLLTEAHDQQGRLLVRNGYRDGLIVSQEYQSGERYEFRYRPSDNRRYVREAAVGLPDGRTQSFHPGDSVPRILKDLPR